MKRISRIEAFLERMKAEGKTRILDDEKSFEAIVRMNKMLEADRMDFKEKNAASEQSAANVWLR